MAKRRIRRTEHKRMPAPSVTVKGTVRATDLGFYQSRRRREGEEFLFQGALGSWMEPVKVKYYDADGKEISEEQAEALLASAPWEGMDERIAVVDDEDIFGTAGGDETPAFAE